MELTDDLLNPDPDLFDPRFVGPRGAKNDIDIYIVGEAPGREEAAQGLPFVGRAGQVLDRAIAESQAASARIRFFNSIPYRPLTPDRENRTPSDEEIKKYSVFVINDVDKTKPKLILLTGKSAMTVFGINGKVSEARTRSFEHKGIPVLVTYHASYVLHQSGWNIVLFGSSKSFITLINDINRALAKSKRPPEVSYSGYEIIDVLEWNKVEEAFANDHEVVLDYEAYGLQIYHADYFIGGIALKGRTSKRCVYVRLYDFWRTPQEFKVTEKIKAKIGLWLLSKKLTVFNLQYEGGASLTYFKVYLQNVTDIMLWNRCLGYSGSLKEIAIQRLGVSAWTSDVDTWVENLTEIVIHCIPTPKGNIREEIKYILEIRPKTIDQILEWLGNPEWLKPRKKALHLSLSKINTLAKKYFVDEKYKRFCERFFMLVVARSEIKDKSVHYTDIPLEIIVPYAIEDANNTDRVQDHMWQEIKAAGLERTAEIYNSQAKLGFEMESSGIAWDDALASNLSETYMAKAISNLRSLLMVPEFQRLLKSPSSETGEVVAHCPQDILTIQTTTDVNVLCSYFNPRSNHEDTRQVFSDLITTGRLRIIILIHEVFKIYEVNKEECSARYPIFTPILEGILECSTLEEEKTKISVEDVRTRLSIIDGLVKNSENLIRKVKNHPDNSPDKWRDEDKIRITPPEIDLVIKYSKWEVESMETSIIEDLYNAFTNIMGLNVDDPMTWCNEFKWIFWFRMFKKVMKNHSTYVWGKNGRSSVTRISKPNIYELSHFRYPGWSERIPDGQLWLKETKFGVCTAVTKRFQSGDHTVPSGSELINLRVSRFPDGVMVHYDYSQMEVRVMARIANEKRLLEAFVNGIDIHLFIASQVWRKPEKEISKQERKSSKAATFSIIYGDTYPNFAVKFVNGNVKLAKYIFDTFFGSFPSVKDYINECHTFALKNGYIKTFFGDPIRIIGMPPEVLDLSDLEKEEIRHNTYSRKVRFPGTKGDRDKDRLLRSRIAKSLRNSQNYPIQSSSSVIAGLGAHYINSYLRNKDMTSRITCFTHDSNDIDAQIADLPEVMSVLPRFAVNELVQEFDLPIRTDFEIGVSGGETIGLKKVQVDGKVITCDFHDSGKTALEAVHKRFTDYGVKMEVEITGEETVYRSLSELFSGKGAFALSMGDTRQVVSGKLKMNFTEVRRSNEC